MNRKRALWLSGASDMAAALTAVRAWHLLYAASQEAADYAAESAFENEGALEDTICFIHIQTKKNYDVTTYFISLFFPASLFWASNYFLDKLGKIIKAFIIIQAFTQWRFHRYEASKMQEISRKLKHNFKSAIEEQLNYFSLA